MKIAIVVHGRFDAFDLARGLLQIDQEVDLYTNYPKEIAVKFGIPRKNIKSFLFHGLLSRIIYRLHLQSIFEKHLHNLFSYWVAYSLSKEYDVVYVFSGVAEKVFHRLNRLKTTKKPIKTLVRGSAHIKTQHELLKEEENRAGVMIEKPSQWIIEREIREYALADKIVVLSSFAYRSFIEQQIPTHQLSVLPLASEVSRFRPDASIIAERKARILSKQPLRILMISSFTFRKGILDFFAVAKALKDNFLFRFVGSIDNNIKPLIQKESMSIEFIPRQPQFELPSFYAWGDIFIFLTIEDGFAVVLSQAYAAGLPILATTNCGAPDFIKEGQTGWILPIRNPQAFIDKLLWCDNHRQALAEMVDHVYNDYAPRDWEDAAKDFVKIHTVY